MFLPHLFLTVHFVVVPVKFSRFRDLCAIIGTPRIIQGKNFQRSGESFFALNKESQHD